MVINFFLTWFVSAAFIYMAASAWIRSAKIIGENIGHKDSDELITTTDLSEVIFTFCVAVTITTISVILLWYIDSNQNQIQGHKIEDVMDSADAVIG